MLTQGLRPMPVEDLQYANLIVSLSVSRFNIQFVKSIYLYNTISQQKLLVFSEFSAAPSGC